MDGILLQPTLKKCPFCAELIQSAAIKCKHCGEIVDPIQLKAVSYQQANTIQQPPVEKWNPGLAAILSFLIPGVGQMYKGDVASGLLWFFFVILGYILLVIPGLILHIICIVKAASGDPYRK